MSSEELVADAYREYFDGNPSTFASLLADEYVQYGPDPQGVYREFRPAEYGKIFAKAADLTETTYTIEQTASVGDEIVFIVVRSNRRAKDTGLTGEYRVASLVHLQNGKITRMVELAEQSAFDFWRAVGL